MTDEKTTQELLSRLLDRVEDTIFNADVDYPDGFEQSSPVIIYDSDALEKYFEAELTAATERAVRAALEAAANVVKEESLDQLNVAIKQGDAGLPYDASDWASRRLNDSAQNIRAMLDDPKAVTKIIEGAQDAKR